jgi:hypothetical protein
MSEPHVRIEYGKDDVLGLYAIIRRPRGMSEADKKLLWKINAKAQQLEPLIRRIPDSKDRSLALEELKSSLTAALDALLWQQSAA